MGDYEAAFSDEEEEAEGREQGSSETASVCDVATASSVEETCNTTETVEDSLSSTFDKKEEEHTSESTSGDSGSESSRPLSPGPTSTQYYYFYQGTLEIIKRFHMTSQ